MTDTIAPGARILCRDAEWLVKSTARASDGSRVIEAVGVSEFIQGRPARFVEELEDDLEVLRPEETDLVADTSSGYLNSLLFIEAHLRQTAPPDERVYVGHRAAMDSLPYQLIPVQKALSTPRQRILIADGVGLGKTLECGILVSELIRRGKGRRILVIATKSMMLQFQKEFWVRFTIPLVRLDSVAIQRIRARIPGNHNPFHYYDRAIISVDTLKQDREYRSYLEKAHWDIIIIDEAHNVARRGKGQGASQRAKLAERLSARSDTLILLSATPHDGRPESFASLMNMLDPTAIANESEYTKEDIRDLYVRRFRKDVFQDLKQVIPEREVQAVETPASVAEERVFEVLNALKLKGIDSRKKAGQLFKTTLLKAMLSSPAACLETVKNRLRRLTRKEEEETDPISTEDSAELRELQRVLEQVEIKDFSKYQRLLKLIQDPEPQGFGWKGKDPTDRLVIFTGRLETMRFLREHLGEDLNLKPEAIEILDGSMPDKDQTAIVENFGQEKAKVRILIATEVASEGLNLHYQSHRLIHFDIPWSLMTLQQRNGRIDRYGQKRQPQIRYLLTRSQLERMDEVERIIKVLLEKDEKAIQNIGDPSVFMGVFEAGAEEEVTAQAIESGQSAEAFSQQLDQNAEGEDEFDFLSWFEDPTGEPASPEDPQQLEGEFLSLFSTTYDYVCKALKTLGDGIQLNFVDQERLIELKMPVELERRYERLPSEILPKETELLQMTDRVSAIQLAMEEARREEARWPSKQYLWDLHPVVEWLTDRCLFRFGRHQAPVLRLSKGMADQEATFVMFGILPNRRGQPVVNRWISVVFEGGKWKRVEDFSETLKRTQLGQGDLPNPGGGVPEDLFGLRAEAVKQARQFLLEARKGFQAELDPKLAEQKRRLEILRDRHVEQLEIRFGEDKRPSAIKEQRRQGELSRIERIFTDYREWVELSMTTEPEPYIKLVAVLAAS